MVPRATMLAIKNLRKFLATLSVAGILVCNGCTPAGPRALLDGKELLESGKYTEAVQKFTTATSLMKTNAQAWNYLGVACHRAGDPVRAAKAYQQALVLDRELFEARFNLGCLLLEQGKPDLAKTEFTACTLRRPNSLESWLKLGATQYRLNELTAAEESFRQALRCSANDPEALNGMGLVSLQRRRPNDAAKAFALALKQRPDYRPALLNLATVSHRQLNDSATALQKYREYLALEPRDADWPAVNAIAESLQQQLAPPPVTRAAQTPLPAPATPLTNNVARPIVATPTQAVATVKTTAPPVVAKNPSPAPVPAQPTAPPPEIVRLPPEPEIKTSVTQVETQTVPSTPPKETVADEPAEPEEVSRPAAKEEKPGLLARLNPFRRDNKSDKSATNTVVTEVSEAVPSSPTDSDAISSARYNYISPTSPAAGNRAEAQRAFAQGIQAQAAKRIPEAIQAFSRAVQLDGSYYDARYNLGIAQYSQRNYTAALATWEYALATKPDSTDARYNLALTLKAAGFPADSAAQLEKILAAATNDVRAHLVLGNLYAEQLRSPAKARAHYQRVLDLEPRHPQASAIRYWMVANPPP